MERYIAIERCLFRRARKVNFMVMNPVLPGMPTMGDAHPQVRNGEGVGRYHWIHDVERRPGCSDRMGAMPFMPFASTVGYVRLMVPRDLREIGISKGCLTVVIVDYHGHQGMSGNGEDGGAEFVLVQCRRRTCRNLAGARPGGCN